MASAGAHHGHRATRLLLTAAPFVAVLLVLVLSERGNPPTPDAGELGAVAPSGYSGEAKESLVQPKVAAGEPGGDQGQLELSASTPGAGLGEPPAEVPAESTDEIRQLTEDELRLRYMALAADLDQEVGLAFTAEWKAGRIFQSEPHINENGEVAYRFGRHTLGGIMRCARVGGTNGTCDEVRLDPEVYPHVYVMRDELDAIKNELYVRGSQQSLAPPIPPAGLHF